VDELGDQARERRTSGKKWKGRSKKGMVQDFETRKLNCIWVHSIGTPDFISNYPVSMMMQNKMFVKKMGWCCATPYRYEEIAIRQADACPK
jgi:hypothetical protein